MPEHDPRFDVIADQRGGFADRWDNMARATGATAPDALPMWVADMDFPTPEPILDALREDLARGVLGYFAQAERVTEAVAGWMERRHGLSVDPESVRYAPGVMAVIGTVIEAFARPGEAIVLFSPVYHAFYGKVRRMGREITECPLRLAGGRYEMDLDDLEARLTGRERLVFLCSPHNPGGRLWDAGEVRALAELCERHDLVLVSDEIHMDLVFPGHRHIPTAVAAPDIAHRLITVSGASKGFNVAGGETAFGIIHDAELRARFDVAHGSRNGTPNRFGMIMLEAAFTRCDAWSDAVRAYLAENFRIWRQAIGALPGIEVMDMPSTYLSWVDFAGTGMTSEESHGRIARDARLGVNRGPQFGTGGETFQRFNIALPRARLREAIARMQAAFGDLQ